MRATTLIALIAVLTIAAAAHGQGLGPFPGTNQDFTLSSAVGMGSTPTNGPGHYTKSAVPGQAITMQIESPNQTFTGMTFGLLLTVHLNQSPINQPIPGLYANLTSPSPFQTMTIIGPGDLLNLGVPATLPPTGTTLSFPFPTELTGFDSLFQSYTIDPMGGGTAVANIVSSDGHRIVG